MKLPCFILLLLISGFLASQNAPVPKNFPSVDGEVYEGKNKLTDVIIKVFNKDLLIATTKTDSAGNYKLKFNIDSVYIVELSKEGYTSKKFEISTKELTIERIKNPVNQINAQTEMHKMVKGVDYSSYKKPMVKFFFNKKTDKFEYDTKHYANAYEAQKKITAKEKVAVSKQKK